MDEEHLSWDVEVGTILKGRNNKELPFLQVEGTPAKSVAEAGVGETQPSGSLLPDWLVLLLN